MNLIERLRTALQHYELDLTNLNIVKGLYSNHWHGDVHVQISIDDKRYAARFIGDQRYEADAFIDLSNEVLQEQIRFCHFLIHAGIPFMKPIPTIQQEFLVVVHIEGEVWRFLLFEWMEGQHLTDGDVSVAQAFGRFARKLHDLSAGFETNTFPQHSHLKGYQEFYSRIVECADAYVCSPKTSDLLKSYFQRIEHHMQQSSTQMYDFIVQSDLNPLNILWNGNTQIVGIVDFESITYTDRLEGLAWLIKWYSRTDGIASHVMSPALAQAVLQGYDASESLNSNDITRLRSLVWLTGCLNWNFTHKTIELMNNREEQRLYTHLIQYMERGENLLALF
ncbi:phosphotransferase enzyme family protein [Paenibacillus kandeliae]|uniref:phosphotransferase enzyme family protein n=1 Tax=Paenibacillus kandeliae TaxID=3231269 RepID=UPI00345B195D